MPPASNGTTSLLNTQTQVRGWLQRQMRKGWIKVSLAGLWLGFVAVHVATDSPAAQLLDRQLQTLFFDMRGPRPAPSDIVILAIDDESLAQAEYYRSDPEQYAALAPIATTPWERRAYALAIDRLMAAGAKAVALDILFLADSGYGPADDDALQAALERWGERVVLAANFDDSDLRQGTMDRLLLPLPRFLETLVGVGSINSPVEIDGRIHRHGRAYLNDQRQWREAIAPTSPWGEAEQEIDTFTEATLRAAQISHPPRRGDFVRFYGPAYTFQHLPFWTVLDPDPWANHLHNGEFFKDKIVLIGATAKSFQDFHPAPFSQTLLSPEPMAGVEILANDLANLRQGTALKQLTSPWLRAALVLALGVGFGGVLWRFNRPVARLGWTVAVGSAWFWIGYGSFAIGGYLLPVGAPILGFMVMGGIYVVADIVTEQMRKQRLRQTLEQYVTSPIVQEIISQQEDLQDLIKRREAEVIGLMLGNRYRITRLLGSGGFGETYVAQDTQRPGSPICVVKQLRIVSDDPKAHQLGQRFFLAEAETLERLGHHDQIPRLLAYFEAHNAFYLVEEMIEGRLLREELASRQPQSPIYALHLLKDLLPVIGFVHSQGVIHRDIKPSNIIRRYRDRRLVLIDFGAVKSISNPLAEADAPLTSTVGVGTQGYMPSEQAAGMPKFASDLYALGITAIEALTGLPAYALKRDPKGEIIWRYAAPDTPAPLADLLSRLVRYNFTDRYPSAWVALKDLEGVEQDLQSTYDDRPLDADSMLWPNPIPLFDLDPEGDPDRTEDPDLAEEGTRLLPQDWGHNNDAESEFPTL
ncbi:MAG: CHASE2 domain-containing protein [Spirulina sp.]